MTRTEDELRATLKEPLDDASSRRLTKVINEIGGQRSQRTRRRDVPGLAIAASVLLVIAVVAGARSLERGAGRDAASSPSSAAGSPGYRYLGPISSARTEAGGALVLEPPPVGTVPALSAAQAYPVWCRAHREECRDATAPDVVLATLTTPRSGPVRSAAGPLIGPGTDHVLSYVFVSHGVDCPYRGGVLSTDTRGSGSAAARPSVCTAIEAVNANTGGQVAGQYVFS